MKEYWSKPDRRLYLVITLDDSEPVVAKRSDSLKKGDRYQIEEVQLSFRWSPGDARPEMNCLMEARRIFSDDTKSARRSQVYLRDIEGSSWLMSLIARATPTGRDLL